MVPAATLDQRMLLFRQRCRELGLACTHQREIIYKALASSDVHPTPEAIYEQVKKAIPAISLGTVYKNIRTFTDAGLLREVNVLHDSLRLDANLGDHHHLVCMHCKKVVDVAAGDVEPVRLKGSLPKGFRLARCVVEILGVCAQCAAKQ